MNHPPATPRQIARIKARAMRKRILIENSSIQAKASKAMRIIALQGKNGMSMNDGMLRAHGLNPKAKEEA